MKNYVLITALMLSANVNALSLTWEAVPANPPTDGYKLYCAPEPIPDLNAVTPIYTGTETVVDIFELVTFNVSNRCWVTSYAGELSSPHSNYLVFTPSTSETITLPAAPGSLTIIW